MDKLQVFKELSESDVWLEEDQHIYIHKKSNTRYTSVTTILSLIKEEFDPTIKTNIVKQYKRLIRELEGLNIRYATSPKEFNDLLVNYLTYKNFFPSEKRTFRDRKTKKLKSYDVYKSFKDYSSLDDFKKELNIIIEKHQHEVDRKKTTYLKTNGKPMNEEEMQTFWNAITKIANIYGTLVHEICEEHILQEQGFLFTNTLTKRIAEGYEINNGLVKEYKSKELFKNSNYVFDEYWITESLSEFKTKIVDAFRSLGWYLGYVCVPEKILHNEKWQLCGTSDIYSYYTPMEFGIKDHKTNKNFTMESPWGTKLKAPFDHLDHCDFNIYNLQLNIYSHMIEEQTNTSVKDLAISYFNKDGQTFSHIELQYNKQDAKTLIELFKQETSRLKAKFSKTDIFDNVPPHYKNNLYFLTEKVMKEHQKTGFYNGKSKKEIKEFYVNLKNEYVLRNQKIDKGLLV